MDTKKCSRCKRREVAEHFKQCLSCIEYGRSYTEKNREAKRERNRQWARNTVIQKKRKNGNKTTLKRLRKQTTEQEQKHQRKDITVLYVNMMSSCVKSLNTKREHFIRKM